MCAWYTLYSLCARQLPTSMYTHTVTSTHTHTHSCIHRCTHTQNICTHTRKPFIGVHETHGRMITHGPPVAGNLLIKKLWLLGNRPTNTHKYYVHLHAHTHTCIHSSTYTHPPSLYMVHVFLSTWALLHDHEKPRKYTQSPGCCLRQGLY